MLNKFAAVILILLISFGAKGSVKNGVITGRVYEKGKSTPLQYATITIQNKEKKILGGTISGDDGNFTIDMIATGECYVKVSFIGYRDTAFIVNLKENENRISLGEIGLSVNPSLLKSATISSKVPLIEQKIDKIIFNVSEAVSTQGNNALELIRKTPGVSIDFNGNILLNGSSVQIWLDGRPSNMSGQQLELMLSGTDAATIDKIEIMSHPSSKYDASGSGGIINIRTKRNIFAGLNGYLNAGYSISPYFDKNYDSKDATINLNYRADKTNTSITYSPRFNDRFLDQFSSTNLGDNLILEGKTKTDMLWKFHNLRFTNDVYLNKKSTIGVILQMFNRKSNKWSDDLVTGNTLFENGSIKEQTFTSIDDELTSKTLSANLNYTYTIKKGQELTINADYGRYNTLGDSFQESIFTDQEGKPLRDPNIFRSNSTQIIDIISARADYEQMISNKYKLEVGAKWAKSFTNNDLLREDKVDNNWNINQNLSSNFNYKENIYASYFSLSRQFGKKWSAKAGLRAEMTDSRGEWISADTITNKNYIDIFPTIFVGYNPKSDIRLGLSYSKRLNRPNYNQLNPFRLYIDAFSSREGNPQLMPQYGHMISLSIGYKRYYSMRLFGQLSNGVISEKPTFNLETGEKYLKYENFGKQEYYGATFSLSELPLQKWVIVNANVNVMGMFNRNEEYSSKSLSANGNINTTFLLPHNFKLELEGFLRSGMTFGYFKMRPSGSLNAGIKKSLFDNKATLTINVSDILNTREEKVVLNSNMMESYNIDTKSNSRQILVSFQYRFGKSKSSRARKVGQNEEAIRTGISN